MEVKAKLWCKTCRRPFRRLGRRTAYEQGVNEYVDTSITFKHFLSEKPCLLHSQDHHLGPGGFRAEMFETLTMIQTRKAPVSRSHYTRGITGATCLT